MKKSNEDQEIEKNEIKPVTRKAHELSFTLLEVIIAVGLLTAVVMQVAGGQGSLFEITDYSKKATEATWLAKKIMSEVEYNYIEYELKELEISIKDEPFKDIKDPDMDYKYSIDIQEWKLPLIDFLSGGGGKSNEEKKEAKDEGKPESSVAGIPGLEGIVNQIFGGHMMKTAHVEVSWPEGARRNSVALTYLLTNQKKLDEYVMTKVAIWDTVRKKMNPNAAKEPPVVPPGGGVVPPGGTPVAPNGTGTNGGTGPLPQGSPAPNGNGSVPETQVPL